MAVDIRQGDYLVVGANEYPIRSCADYAKTGMLSASFLRMATISASTKRSPAIANGKRGDLATNLTGLVCSPLDPVSAEQAQRLVLDTPHELLQTFVSDGTGFVHLVLEDLR